MSALISCARPTAEYYNDCVRAHYFLVEGYWMSNYSAPGLNPIVAKEIDAFVNKYKDTFNSDLESFHWTLITTQRYAHGMFDPPGMPGGDNFRTMGAIKSAIAFVDDEQMANFDEECKRYKITVDYEKIRQEVITELEKAVPAGKGNQPNRDQMSSLGHRLAKIESPNN